MIKPLPTKDPDSENIRYYFNWSDWVTVEAGGVIASYEVTIDEAPDNALVIVDSTRGEGEYLNWIQVRLSGGTLGETYLVRCAITLADTTLENHTRSITIDRH